MYKRSQKNFKSLIREKASDLNLGTIVRKATLHSLSKRASTIKENYPEWEKLREEAKHIREEVLRNWGIYFQKLKQKLQENGIELYLANNSEEACKIVYNLISSQGKKSVVKSKSMVTEEIGLNEYLQAKGYEITETDLGEYIIQLAEETPSHITAPALHKSRKEIGALFHEKLNIEYTDAPDKLTYYARSILREKFLNANVGISGANFLVVETGSIIIVENEGNARLSTTLPELHIVISSIEKIVPTLSNASTLLKLLTASATGQKITSYVSIINKANKDYDLEGPKKIAVVLVDNNRSSLLSDDKLRSILYCIKCGACMNVCPVYQTVGGHAYGTVYPGPIGSILTPWLIGLEQYKNLAFCSTLCGACEEICPVKVDIYHHLLRLRSASIEKKFSSVLERLLFKMFLYGVTNFKIYRMISKVISFLSPLFQESGFKVPNWSKYKYFPAPAEVTFHEWWKSEVLKKGKSE